MFNIRKKLAVILVAAIVVGQCGVTVFAYEQIAKAISESTKSVATATESDAEYDAISYANAECDVTSSSNAKYIIASSSNADYEEDIDFVPEELLVSVRGGLDGLYFTNDENQDTTFLDDFTFESLAIIEDKYDRGNDIVEVVGETEEEAPDEVDFSDDNEEDKTAKINEYQVFRVKTPGYKTKEQLTALANKIVKLPAVQYAELNQVMHIESTNTASDVMEPTDRQWAYNDNQGNYSMGVTDPEYSGNDKLINWNEYDPAVASPSAAPKIKTTSNNPVVVVMDTGIDYEHEDLKNVMWTDTFNLGGGTHGFDASAAPNSGAEPMDDSSNGHGTHCAGIIAAEWNRIGVSGITSGVKLMGIRVEDNLGRILLSYICSGYEYLNRAQDAGVNVVSINCSWGLEYKGDIITQFVTRAGEKGAVSCFASGNEEADMDKKLIQAGGLSDNPYTVIVNACDNDGNLAIFSNYGLKSTDVAAPGVSIYSTINRSNSKADCCSPYTTPVKDTNEKDVIDDYNGGTKYFSYEYENASYEYLSSGGINNTGCLKVTPTKNDKPITVDLDFTNTVFKTGEDKPTSIGFAINCPKPTDCMKVWVDIYRYDTTKKEYVLYNIKDGEKIPKKYSISSKWQSFEMKIDDTLIAGKKVRFEIYCSKDTKGTKDNRVYSGYDVFIDRMMFTNKELAYEILNGTSMAAPAVTGEAAVLSEYFYQNSMSNKSERAKNIAARIKGSVQESSKFKKIMQSGGAVRVDYAVHGKTNPVINDLTINKINGKYIANLNGYFFDGNAGKGESDESFISLDIDGKTMRASNINSTSGETITFYIPQDLLTGEHFYEITSTKGTGSAYIESHVSDVAAKNKFIQIPISEKNTDMMQGVPLNIKAVNGNMYLLIANESSSEVTLWYQNIDETLFGSNQTGEWTQAKDFAGTGQNAYYSLGTPWNMAVIGDKLVGIGLKWYSDISNYQWSIWEFDTRTNKITDIKKFDRFNNPATKAPYIFNGRVFYTGKRLFLTYAEYDDTTMQSYKTYYCELNPNDYSIKSSQVVRSNDKRLAEIISDGSNYYAVCGQANSGNGTYTIDRLEVDTVGNTGITGMTQVNSNVLDGIENLYNDDVAVVTSAAYANGKTIFTGPAIAYDEYIEADTYMMSDMTKSAIPVNKFVSTSPLLNTCCTVDSYGNYYVIANTKNASHNWIYAYTDTSELGKYVHKDRVIWSYDIEGSSGGNGSNTATPYYPSYVERGGKWVKVTGADGKITWRFTDSKGELCVNKWVAIPDEDGLTGGPFGWYRFDANGNMITGWYTDDKGRRFYLDPTEGNLKGKMKTGWILIDGKWYYFKETGKDDFGVLVPDKIK